MNVQVSLKRTCLMLGLRTVLWLGVGVGCCWSQLSHFEAAGVGEPDAVGEESAFEALLQRITPTPFSDDELERVRNLLRDAPEVWKPARQTSTSSQESPPWLRQLEQILKVSGISLSSHSRIAIVECLNHRLRVREDDVLLNSLRISKIERDRIQLVHSRYRPFWVYRVKPGVTWSSPHAGVPKPDWLR